MRRGLAVLFTTALLVGAYAGSAAAEHPASKATFRAINRLLAPSARTLDDHLASVELSSFGPYALALESGGQVYHELFKRGKRGRWLFWADVSMSTGLRCGAAPQAVLRDLHVLRYALNHRCYRGV